MIEPKELRIGNLVKYTGTTYPTYPLHDGIVTVEQVLHDGVNLSHGDSTLYESDLLEGIHLTPEWLERCVFVWDEKDYDGETIIYNKGCLGLHHDEDQPLTGWSIAIMDDGNICFSGHEIYFLHQLQNLYFSLTGEELQIKES